MGKAVDLTGQRFGSLVVQGRGRTDKSRSIHWKCKCDCGNETEPSGSNLRKGRSTTCGSCCFDKTDEIVGKKFGRLTVLGKEGKKLKTLCECGNTHLVKRGSLLDGNTKSCGCLQEEKKHLRNFKHGGAKRIDGKVSVEYQSWCDLFQADTPYPEEWKDFKEFFKTVGWRPSDKHVLSRRDIREPHSKENTYWRDKHDEQQQRQSAELGQEFTIDLATILSNSAPREAVTA